MYLRMTISCFITNVQDTDRSSAIDVEDAAVQGIAGHQASCGSQHTPALYPTSSAFTSRPFSYTKPTWESA